MPPGLPVHQRTLITCLALCSACGTAVAQLTVLGVQYQPDRAFPEYQCFWHDAQFPGPCSDDPRGANVHVYVRNTGASSVTVDDVTLAGMSLEQSLVEQEQVVKRHPCSIWFASLTPQELQTLLDAGEPVWYKADPAPIPAGGTAQVVVRLRSIPVTPTVSIGVIASTGSVSAVATVSADAPQAAGASFSSDLTKVYLYWRRGTGSAPTMIRMDGADLTGSTVTVNDATVGLAVSVLQLSQPLTPGSFHVFQGSYADGTTATTGLRAWANPFIYGTWGAQAGADDDFDAARAWIDDAANHSANALVAQLGSAALGDYLKTAEGRQYAADHGYGFVIDAIGKWSCSTPLMWFVRDEPDAADSRVENLAENKKIGSLGMMCIEQGEALRAAYPAAPTALNIDGTYKPYNWYNYGQVPDVLMTDPYYQARLREAIWNHPERVPLYSKATYIHAVTSIAQASCEPNPLHVILYSCEYRDASGSVFPFPTPQSKRIEVYYALAGGAKGISYWWYLPGSPSNGLGAGSATALALWREIGLLGAEIRTAAPLLANSCPATVGVQASAGLWVRSLLVGGNTMVLLVVNDQYYNDEDGCHYTPVSSAALTVDLPAWMETPNAFEIATDGTRDIGTLLSAGDLQVSLGSVDLTRMIVVTTDSNLRTTLQQRFDQQVRSRLCTMAPEVCQTTPPSITQQPQPLDVCAGGTASFTISAAGSGTLAYRWQKNQIDLTDGGHYSGATTPTLSITGVTAEDAAAYRCVVTNSYGTATSSEAALSVTDCGADCLQNGGFENGFTAGVGNGWIKFNRVGDVTCSDETTEHYSGSHSQEVYSHDLNNDGGVYQRFAVTAGEVYRISAWFKVYSPQGTGIAEGWLGIDPLGGTDPYSSSIIWSSKPYNYWSQKTWTGSAQANLITVYLRGLSTKAASLNKVGYIWMDDVTVTPVAPTDGVPQALSSTSIRWTWAALPVDAGYRVRDAGGEDKSGALPVGTTQWDEVTGLAPNTLYTRRVCVLTTCGESTPSAGQTRWTLPTPPTLLSVTPSAPLPCSGRDIVWSASAGFGPGTVQYYRHAWGQDATHTWTGSEPQWSDGTMTTRPTSAGTWYLHLQSHNGEDIAGGMLDYALVIGTPVAPDLDGDCDVDADDFTLFGACASGTSLPFSPDCGTRDFDHDNDVDMDDFAVFQRCYSGNHHAPPSGCAN